ncbi:MAG: acyl carrier protein [Peptococcaceae bacterium]|nr:acyl carrier protein [Peptococcaceae bacterium]
MIFERLKSIVDEHFIYEGELTPATKIIDDLGADSFDIPVLINALEDEFGITIITDDVLKLKTIEDVLSIIKSKL